MRNCHRHAVVRSAGRIDEPEVSIVGGIAALTFGRGASLNGFPRDVALDIGAVLGSVFRSGRDRIVLICLRDHGRVDTRVHSLRWRVPGQNATVVLAVIFARTAHRGGHMARTPRATWHSGSSPSRA